MTETSPFPCARYIKEIGRGPTGARALSRDDTYALYEAMLDNRVSDLELGAVLTAPGCGRGWIRAVLQEWGLLSAIDVDLAELLVSELLTNAVAASARCGTTTIHLGLASDRQRMLITVRDFALGAPAPRRPSADDDSGRGLQIVSELAEQYGWQPPRDGGPGKVVWILV